MKHRALRILAILAIAFAAFAAWVHPATLDITRVGWALHDDWGTNVVGFNAYLKSGAWPGIHQPLMVAPEGASLLLTDSVPLIGLALKPFAGLLPAGVQMIGWWLLACLILHAGFAYLLVRRYAPDFLTAWLGTALLTLVPALFNRYPHPSLCAHWVILWALWVFLDPRGSRQVGWWLAVIGVAGLIHSYLLLMVGAIWASALLERLWRRDWRTAAVQAGAVGVLVAAIALLLGVTGQGYVSTHSYGGFPMALDALVNPATTHVSALLPNTPDDLGRGFEGLQYLGVGLMLLILAAIGTRTVRREERGPSLHRLVWLAPAFVVLTLLALSSRWVFQGQTIVTIPLPVAMIDALDPIRASGRLFWPVLYTGLFVAIVSVERLRLPVARLVLAGALALQIVDIAPMLAWTRHETAAAGETATYRRATDNRWTALIAGASAIEFQPTSDSPDTGLLSEIGWRAMLACRPMRFSAVARLSAAQRARFERDRAAFLAGRIDPTRLYVLFAGEPVPAALAGRERVIDGVVIIPPAAPAPPPTLCGGK